MRKRKVRGSSCCGGGEGGQLKNARGNSSLKEKFDGGKHTPEWVGPGKSPSGDKEQRIEDEQKKGKNHKFGG